MPFDFLRRADARQVLSYLQDEHPQTIALVVAHMHPEQGAIVLSGLPEELQAEVARRIANMDRTSPEVIRQVEGVLERKLSSFIQSQDLSSAGGIQPLVDILNRSGRTTERAIIEGLEREDPELAEKVRSMLFVFEDIVQLDDRSMQLVLREVDTKELAVAIKGVSEEVKAKILKNMSDRAAENLVDESEMLGPVRLKTVEEAQSKVVRVIRRLEEADQLSLSRGGTEEFVS
jgi:flagellar motor switch protein FliG